MNNPNPFLPQGSLEELKNQKRARLKTAVFSFLGGSFVLVASALLIQGCGKEPTKTSEAGPTSGAPALPDNTAVGSTSTNSGTGTSTLPSDINATTPAPTNSAPQISSTPTGAPTTGSSALQPIAPQLTPVNPMPPVTSTVSAPMPTGTTTEYVVAKGDSFSTIAKKVHVSSKAIVAANPGVVPTKLKVGQKLQIPAGGAPMVASASPTTPSSAVSTSTDAKDSSTPTGIYVVKAHDTLTKIAHVNGTTIAAIKAENHLKTSSIRVGDKLKLPVKGAPVSSAAADTTPMTIPSAPVMAASNVTTPVSTAAPVTTH